MDELLTHHSGGWHGDLEPSDDDLPFGRVSRRAPEPSRSRVDDNSGDGIFHGIMIGYLGFSCEEVYMGEGATSVEARGPHTMWRRAKGGTRAATRCGRLGALLQLFFGLCGCIRENRSVAFRFVQFREYFLNNFFETKNSRKHATGTVASC